MKKLLLVLLFVPLISFGQTKDEYEKDIDFKRYGAWYKKVFKDPFSNVKSVRVVTGNIVGKTSFLGNPPKLLIFHKEDAGYSDILFGFEDFDHSSIKNFSKPEKEIDFVSYRRGNGLRKIQLVFQLIILNSKGQQIQSKTFGDRTVLVRPYQEFNDFYTPLYYGKSISTIKKLGYNFIPWDFIPPKISGANWDVEGSIKGQTLSELRKGAKLLIKFKKLKWKELPSNSFPDGREHTSSFGCDFCLDDFENFYIEYSLSGSSQALTF